MIYHRLPISSWAGRLRGVVEVAGRRVWIMLEEVKRYLFREEVREAMAYSSVGLLYLLLTAAVYPSFWLGLCSLVLPLGWKFKIGVLRFLPIFILPYAMLPLEPSGKYILLGLACALVYFSWHNLKLTLPREGEARLVRWGLVVLQLATMFTLIGASNAFRLHHNLQTYDFDLGVFDNIFFNMMEGRGMYNPLERGEADGSHFKVHFSPSLYLLLPLYAMVPRAETLQFLQLALIGGAGVVLYLLVAKSLGPRGGAAVGAAWIFYTPLLGGAFYDFHEICLGPFLLFSVGLSLQYGHRVLPWILAILTLGVKEDFSLFVAPAFVFLGWWTNRVKTGVGLSILAIGFFLSVRWFWTVPYGENWFQIYHRVGAGSFSELVQISLSSPWTVVEAILAPPAAVTTLELLVPLCFLPLLSGWSFVLSFLPVLALFPGAEPMRSNYFQYTLLLAPMIFLGLIHLLRKWRGEKLNHGAWALLVMTFLTQATAGTLSGQGFRSGFNQIVMPVTEQDRVASLEIGEIKKNVPPEASIAVPPHVASHFSNRKDCFTTKYWEQAEFVQRKAEDLPLYLITVTDSHLDPNSRYFLIRGGEQFELWEKRPD